MLLPLSARKARRDGLSRKTVFREKTTVSGHFRKKIHGFCQQQRPARAA